MYTIVINCFWNSIVIATIYFIADTIPDQEAGLAGGDITAEVHGRLDCNREAAFWEIGRSQ